MAVRKKQGRQREAQLGFEALSIEGGLLSPDWLARAAQLTAGGQSEADYRIPKGLNLRDEVGRYWRIAQAYWSEFAAGRAGKAAGQPLADQFVRALLQESFGFASLQPVAPVVLAEHSYPIGLAALEGRVPVVVAPAGSGLDTLATPFGDSGRRRSAFGLAQEFLNAADGALWGLASDGLTLRIVRDNSSLTRPAWIEADLARIFTEERYADFAALWLLAHETRFGAPGQPVTDCALESWRNAGREEGTRAREQLRRGVEDALLALGQGFLAHPDNQALRAALQTGALTRRDYFNQLLRLVYRMIFLLTVEERGLLHPDGADEQACALYAAGYGMRRLRDRSLRRGAHDRFADLWEAVKIVFRSLATGQPLLALPALAGIFATSQCPALDAARLENRSLLFAFFRLCWLREAAGLARVNWRDMGPEELGSVYESLLELEPQITQDGRQFTFATGDETRGNARKTTGSYYTPDSLVQVLLNGALEPVIASTMAAHLDQPAAALLQLTVVDPACGSGHFLLAAARRLAVHVARLEAHGTPSAAQYRHALRQVVGHCIFGVDLNPMAVELCKVSLWMEALEPGLPLTFLDSHIRHGNALLGTNEALMEGGIPDAAWEPLEGDDRKVASALKKRNKQAAAGQRGLETLWSDPLADAGAELDRALAELEAASDANVSALAAKAGRWQALLDSAAYQHLKFVADAWCSAFVWPKQPGALAEAAPTNQVWRQIRDRQGQPDPLTVGTIDALARQYHFFHWPLAFRPVFKRGGFDVVLGNPPWERVKLQEQEFFASRDDAIAKAPNAAARKKLIAALPDTNRALWVDWCEASREADGESHFARKSGRYPLCGRGDVNTYALFAEQNRAMLGQRGRAGFIVPTGIATDDTTKEYFTALTDGSQLRSLLDFQSGPGLFGEIGHARFKFCLLTLGSGDGSADLLFFARSIDDLADHGRHFVLDSLDFATLNPNTRTCPTFRSRRDAAINLAIYRRAGVLWLDDDASSRNLWSLQFRTRLWHMAEDAAEFHTRTQLEADGWLQEGNRYVRAGERRSPLLEAKMLHHFDHRFGDYADKPGDSESTALPEVPAERLNDPGYSPLPRYWVDADEVQSRLKAFWSRGWLLGWRDICRSTDERTVVACLIPRSAVGHTMPLMFPDADPVLVAALYANLCSFAIDYAARQKVGGTHLAYGCLKQLPVLPPSTYAATTSWSPDMPLHAWLLGRVLELTYTAWDLEPFARDVGYEGPPFRWVPERRFQLRCELDAAFFHLYGLDRDDTAFVLDTFPIVRRNDEKLYGEYRTKRAILEVYDSLATAAHTGRPYRTPLDPLPAAPGASHGIFTADGTPKDYAEALLTGLLFTLIRRGGDAGVSTGTLSRALLWIQNSRHAAAWLEGDALTDFREVGGSDPLLARGAADSQVPRLLDALENEQAITRDAKGIVRIRAGSSIPNWLPQTATLAKLASLMRAGLERAEAGVTTTPAAERLPSGRVNQA